MNIKLDSRKKNDRRTQIAHLIMFKSQEWLGDGHLKENGAGPNT